MKVGKHVGTRTGKNGKTKLVRLPDKPKKTDLEKWVTKEKKAVKKTLQVNL